MRLFTAFLVVMLYVPEAQAQSPDSVFVEHVTATAGDTVDVQVRIKNSFDVLGITLPLVYSGTGVTLLSGAAAPRADTSIFQSFAEWLNPGGPQTALYGLIAFSSVGMSVGDGSVLTLTFEIAADAPEQVIIIDTTFLPPANTLTLHSDVSSIFPEWQSGSITVLPPAGVDSCIVDLTGDVNLSGGVNAADIVCLVLEVFYGACPPQPCVAVGDVNCTGRITSSDIIHLVNYAFKNGPAPCDVCSLVPDVWSCP